MYACVWVQMVVQVCGSVSVVIYWGRISHWGQSLLIPLSSDCPRNQCPTPQCWHYRWSLCLPDLYIGTGDPHVSLHACKACTLSCPKLSFFSFNSLTSFSHGVFWDSFILTPLCPKCGLPTPQRHFHLFSNCLVTYVSLSFQEPLESVPWWIHLALSANDVLPI